MSYMPYRDKLQAYMSSLSKEEQDIIARARNIAYALSKMAGENEMCMGRNSGLAVWCLLSQTDIREWVPGGISILDTPQAFACASDMQRVTTEPRFVLPDYNAENLLISTRFIHRSPDAVALVEELSEIVPVLYDQRKDSRGVQMINMKGIVSTMRYTGPVPENVFFAGMKCAFMESVCKIWNSNVIVGRKEHRYDRRLRGLTRAKALADAMLMGRTKICLPTGHGTGANLQDYLQHMFIDDVITATNMTEKMEQTYNSVREFRDICELWKYAAEEYSISMRLDESDLNDAEKIAYQIGHLGEALHVPDYMSVYEKGVPIEDMLA